MVQRQLLGIILASGSFYHHDFDGPDMICVLHPFLKDGFQLSETLHVVGNKIVLISEQNGSQELSFLYPLIFWQAP